MLFEGNSGDRDQTDVQGSFFKLIELFDMDSAISKVGDEGAYQKGMAGIAVICLFAASFMSFFIGFAGADPITECL